jgi:hypothetical protein
MLEPEIALLVLNVVGPFDGRRISADVVRSNVNAKSVRPLTQAQFEEVVRELVSRNWISERFNAFSQSEIGITPDGQITREKFNQ